MMPGRICLAGSTGYLGSRLAAQLRARGIPLTAIVRSRESTAPIDELLRLGADLAFVDASRHEAYADALADAGTAVSCMASRNVNVDASNDFWAIDRDANIRFALAGIAAGARHVVLVATFEGRASRSVSEFSEAKEQAVDAIAAACEGAGVRFTVVRPTAYFSDLTNRAFDSVAARNRHIVLGGGNHRINPVSGEDVASFIADRITDPDPSDRQYPVGGPQTFTFRQIGELAADVLGKSADLRIRSMPIGLLRAVAMLASAAGLCSHKMRRIAAVMRWMIYAGTHDAIAPCCGPRELRWRFESMAAAAKAGTTSYSMHWRSLD